MVRQTRRQFLKSITIAAASFLSLPGCIAINRVSAKRNRPNILFFFTDDQQFDTIRASGNKHIHTPNIDTLVRSGTTFTNAYIMGSMTGAVCMPSRAMLMSSRTLFRFEPDAYVIPKEYVTLPQCLRKAGYTTFHTGKWHQDVPAHGRSFSSGGKVFFGGMSDHYRVPVFDFDPQQRYPSRDELRKLRRPENVKKRKKARHSSELFTDSAIDFLRGYKDTRPFFMYISYTAPHRPRQAPQEYIRMYDVEKMPLPKSFMPEHPFDIGDISLDEKIIPKPRTEKEMRKNIRNYYEMITHLDAQIGRVLKVLKEGGDFENTTVIFASDNGLAMSGHGLVGKQSLYEHCVKVPLIMAGPGIPKGERRDDFCYLLDIFPTLCEIIGIDVPATVEGISFAKSLSDREHKTRKSMFFAYKDFQRAVRDGRYKLIEYVVEGKRHTQLFDLQADPWELNNLTDNPAYEAELKRLRMELLRLKKELGDRSEFWQHYDGTG